MPFDREAQKALFRYVRGRETGPLWVGPDGQGMARTAISSDLYRMYERAGYLGVLADACHIFRRTWALNLLRDGLGINDLRVLGGWESLEIIIRHYVPLISSDDALAAVSKLKRR